MVRKNNFFDFSLEFKLIYSKGGYQLINNGKNLLILAKSLKSFPDTIYQFTIETDYDAKTYSQIISIQIDPKSVIPIVDLK